ncbi:protein ESKIMO 1-like [Iris pallida]|uniref:Protein ESKIMO 1-like n=1 Tax=Iris pallida TaxID=29817 RepID=A0AAX6F8M9_IRIPA|nr:protein ESKIMO 1-like [Iris pallida]
MHIIGRGGIFLLSSSPRKIPESRKKGGDIHSNVLLPLPPSSLINIPSFPKFQTQSLENQMDNYPLHLAVAAMAGASLAAVYAYCAHLRALSQLLDSALASEAERDRNGGPRLVPRLRRGRRYRRRSTSSSGAAAASGGSHRRHAIPRDMAVTHWSLLGEDWYGNVSMKKHMPRWLFSFIH